MTQREWIDSLNKSWGCKMVEWGPGRNTRVDLLEQCEIKGDCWVSADGMTLVGSEFRPVQRAAYTMFCGPIPHKRGARIEATCGNERCCLPDHLSLIVVQSVKHEPV